MHKFTFMVFFVLFYSSVIFAGQLQSVSSSKYVWIENGQQLATIKKTSANNWKVKRHDGFYIGLITKRGDMVQREDGLKIYDLRLLMDIHEQLVR